MTAKIRGKRGSKKKPDEGRAWSFSRCSEEECAHSAPHGYFHSPEGEKVGDPYYTAHEAIEALSRAVNGGLIPMEESITLERQIRTSGVSLNNEKLTATVVGAVGQQVKELFGFDLSDVPLVGLKFRLNEKVPHGFLYGAFFMAGHPNNLPFKVFSVARGLSFLETALHSGLVPSEDLERLKLEVQISGLPEEDPVSLMRVHFSAEEKEGRLEGRFYDPAGTELNLEFCMTKQDARIRLACLVRLGIVDSDEVFIVLDDQIEASGLPYK